jgi:hypothetical protein
MLNLPNELLSLACYQRKNVNHKKSDPQGLGITAVRLY